MLQKFIFFQKLKKKETDNEEAISYENSEEENIHSKLELLSPLDKKDDPRVI